MARSHKKLQAKHGKPRTNTKLIDQLTYIAAIVEPIITLPQAYQIFRDRSAAGVSISAWIGYEALQMIWLWYGIVHKDKAIIIYSILYAVVQAAVIFGAIMYGGKFI